MEENRILDVVWDNPQEWTNEQIGNFIRKHGKCRVCGAPALGNMPCRRCCLLLLDRDNEKLDVGRRGKAELERIAKGAE